MMAKNNRTFVIQIKSTDHNTWQGTVDWVERKQKASFRSALELIRLMDSSINIREEQEVEE